MLEDVNDDVAEQYQRNADDRDRRCDDLVHPAYLLLRVFVVGAGLRAQLLPAKTGKQTLVGKTVAALAPIDAASGKVFIEGEYWNAVSDAPVAAGDCVEVVGVDGLTLKVKRKAS